MIIDNIQYKLDDYILANRTHFTKSLFHKIFKWVCLIIGIMILIILAIEKNLTIELWIAIIYFILYFLYLYIGIPISSRYFFNKQPNFKYPHRIEITQKSITEDYQIGNDEYNYLIKVIETKEIIIAYNSPRTFIMLPKRLFSNDTDYEEAKKLVRELTKKKV